MAWLQVASVGICVQLLSLAANSKLRDASLPSIQLAMIKAAQTSGNRQLPFTAASGDGATSLPALDVLRVQPVAGMYSRFFGQSEVRPRMTQAVWLLRYLSDTTRCLFPGERSPHQHLVLLRACYGLTWVHICLAF